MEHRHVASRTAVRAAALERMIAEAAYAPVSFDTLRDHALYQLYADCAECHYRVRLNVMQIARQAGWDTPLATIHAALRCPDCGAGEMRMVSVQR